MYVTSYRCVNTALVHVAAVCLHHVRRLSVVGYGRVHAGTGMTWCVTWYDELFDELRDGCCPTTTRRGGELNS